MRYWIGVASKDHYTFHFDHTEISQENFESTKMLSLQFLVTQTRLSFGNKSPKPYLSPQIAMFNT